MTTNSVSTAVTNVTPARKGRTPTVLPSGKPLAEARTAAKNALAAAKTDLRNAKAVEVTAGKAVTLAERSLAIATKDAEKAKTKFASAPGNMVREAKAGLKANWTAMQAIVKTKGTEAKAARTAFAAAQKATKKQNDAVTKAEAARLKIEGDRLPKTNGA